MKRDELLRRVRDRARVVGVEVRQGRPLRHGQGLIVGEVSVMIPRHREINRYTAEGICKDLEPALGEEWWKE